MDLVGLGVPQDLVDLVDLEALAAQADLVGQAAPEVPAEVAAAAAVPPMEIRPPAAAEVEAGHLSDPEAPVSEVNLARPD